MQHKQLAVALAGLCLVSVLAVAVLDRPAGAEPPPVRGAGPRD